jgi:hypothetical protein
LLLLQVEVKVLQIEPGSSAAVVIQNLLRQQQDQQQDRQQDQQQQQQQHNAVSLWHQDEGNAIPQGAHESKTPTSAAAASTGNSSSSSSDGSHSSLLRPSMTASIPSAFELRTASVCLWGLDLPLLLHPSAALPPQYEVLPGLADSVEAARVAVETSAAAAAAAAVAAAVAAGREEGETPVAVLLELETQGAL